MSKEFIFTLNNGTIQFYFRIAKNDIKIAIKDQNGNSVFLPLDDASFKTMVKNLKSDISTFAFGTD